MVGAWAGMKLAFFFANHLGFFLRALGVVQENILVLDRIIRMVSFKQFDRLQCLGIQADRLQLLMSFLASAFAGKRSHIFIEKTHKGYFLANVNAGVSLGKGAPSGLRV